MEYYQQPEHGQHKHLDRRVRSTNSYGNIPPQPTKHPTKEEKEEPQTQYEEQLHRYQELTLIGVNSIIETNKEDHKIANNRIKKEITKI